MKKILFYLCLAVFSASFSQLPRSLLLPASERPPYDSSYRGSVYVKFEYKESSVIDEKSTSYDAKLKYNTYSDAIEVTINSEVYELVKSPTTHARIDNEYFYYCNFKSLRGLSRKGYYVLVELTDRYRIYKRFTLKIREPEKRSAISSNQPQPGVISTVTSYYIEEAGVIMKLPLNKKQMLAIFSDKENELKAYIKKERIRLKKEEDLIRFIARYNALKSDETSRNRSLLSNANSGRK